MGIRDGDRTRARYKGVPAKASARICYCGSSPPKAKEEIMMLEHFNLSSSELDRLGPRHLS